MGVACRNWIIPMYLLNVAAYLKSLNLEKADNLLPLGGFGAVNQASSYRSTKIPKSAWTGKPDSTPAIFTYANSTSLFTTFYVSWNGATETSSWRFLGGSKTIGWKVVEAGKTAKGGFGKIFIATEFVEFGWAQALDANGNVLGTSPSVLTFTPYSAEMLVQNSTGPATTNTTATLRRTNKIDKSHCRFSNYLW